MNWLDRLIPLPKEIEITGIRRAKAGEISIYICGGEPVSSEPAVRTAARLLRKFALSSSTVTFPIKMALAEDCKCAIASKEIVSRLYSCPNPEQAYAIIPSSDSNGINLVAITPIGLLFAARTFAQLVYPGCELGDDDEILLPLPFIVDWPDIAERGQWGGNTEADLKWTSQWKLNHLEAHVSVKNNSDGYPEAQINPKLFEETRSQGVNLVPFIAHLESISLEIGDLPVGAKSTPDPTKPLPSDYFPGMCSSSPVSVELIATWLESVADAAPFTDICVWLSEQSSPCFCKDCIGQEQFELETILICKAFDIIRPRHPQLKLRLLLTQGSYPYNDKVLAAKSPDVGVTYYDGGRTYDSSRQPMIYPLLEEYSCTGGWLGCYPQITHCWRAIFPWTAPQFLQYRAQEFADKKLDSFTGYAVISNRQHEFNVAAMAEYTWNSHGRTPEEFAKAYATVEGYENPSAFAKWAVLAGEAGWALAESNLFLTLIYDPTLGLQGEVHTDHRFEKAQLSKTGKLDEALNSARDALAAANLLGIPNAIRESECCLASLTAYSLLKDAQELLRIPELTDQQRSQLAVVMDGMDRVTQIVAVNQLAWAKDIEEKAKSNTLHSRVYDTGLVLFRTCDALRSAAVKFGIPDPRPEYRLCNLGSWTGETFTANIQPVLEWDISELADGDGGDYVIGVHFIDSAYHTDIHSIQAIDESGNVVAEAENTPGDVSIWERWKDFPILLPKHDGRLTLRVKISGFPADAPADRRTCEGTLGIRKAILH